MIYLLVLDLRTAAFPIRVIRLGAVIGAVAPRHRIGAFVAHGPASVIVVPRVGRGDKTAAGVAPQIPMRSIKLTAAALRHRIDTPISWIIP